MIAVAFRAKNSSKQHNFNWLEEHKNIPLGQKRKPGRPARMKKALQYQDNEEYLFQIQKTKKMFLSKKQNLPKNVKSLAMT